jgi:tetratricopeptide (TPR) repeat protein
VSRCTTPPATFFSSPGTAIGVLLLLTVVAYSNSFAGAFVFDDRSVVLDDARLESLAAFRSTVSEAIRPFTKTTFLIDRSLYGSRPAGYHVLNLLLHLASGLLLYGILIHPAFHDAGGWHRAARRRRIAFWTTLLFLLHPVATEAVTYISGRATGLMTCAYLAAFLLFLEARAADPATMRQRLMAAGAAAALALSLLAKEVALVFPAMLGVYELVLRRPKLDELGPTAIRVHSVLVAVVLVFVAAALLHARYVSLFRYSLALRSSYENLLTQANAIVYAVTLFVRPGQLNADHDLPLYTSVLQGGTLLALAAVAALASSAIALARRSPLFAFGIFWFLLHLAPTNSFLPRTDVLSERNLYLPSIGLFLSATVVGIAFRDWLRAPLPATDGGSWLRRYERVAVSSVLVLIVAALLGATVRRNAVYRDSIAFWSDAVQKSPHKARPHANLGQAWLMAGELDRAIEQFRVALTLDPLNLAAQRNLLEAWARKTDRDLPRQTSTGLRP